MKRLSPQRARRAAMGVLVMAALVLLGEGGWIHAKAGLSQVLLRQAWAKSQDDQREHRPWPWADTHPVARLRVDHLGVDQIVLAGDSGRVLAFGPGWAPASAAPGGSGNTVFSGHRDTHFDWLRGLQVGDRIVVEAAGGEARYEVTRLQVADSRHEQIALESNAARLTLVTCWPFDAISTGGPLRYVVTARRV